MNPKNIIEYQGKPTFVTVPFDKYQELVKLQKHNLTDEQLYLQKIAKVEEYFPTELVNKILNGENPIKIYREYRGFSQVELAIKISKTKQYISSLEKGQRTGTIHTLKKIAQELNIDLDMLN